MSNCTRCNKEIYGEDLYEQEGKVYCESCAQGLTRDSLSASPTGFGCIGSYKARKEYLEEQEPRICPVDWEEDKD